METSTMMESYTRTSFKSFFCSKYFTESWFKYTKSMEITSCLKMGAFQSKKRKKSRPAMKSRKRKVYDESSEPCKEFDFSSDGVLRTEDGNKFKIGRNFLALQCPFFRALFSGNFGDGTDVLLKGIEGQTLDSILTYMYNGTIHLDKKNAIDILVASDYLLFDPLVEKSSYFVLMEMTTANCVSLFLLACSIGKLNMLNKCYRFIVVHFEKVVSNSKEIRSLPFEALKKFLAEKSLNVSTERTVWNFIVKWIRFDSPHRLQFIPELLQYISLKDLDSPLLNDIFSHNFIQKNRFCKKLVFGVSQNTANLQNFRLFLNSQSNMPGSRTPTNSNLIIYNCTSDIIFNKHIYLTWDGEVDYWRKVGSIHFFPDHLIQLDRYVYMFDTTLNISLAFDILHNKCLPVTSICESRYCYYSVVSVNGFIYRISGRRNNEIYNAVQKIERLDPKTRMWELVSRMRIMLLLKAVALNGQIYAIGYTTSNRGGTMMAKVYNPASDRWSSISAPRLFNTEINAVVFRGRLCIIFGGSNIEEYDPVCDVWIPMPNLPFNYHSPSPVVLKDVLIVYEEHLMPGSCGENTPPVYWIPKNRTWSTIQESSPLRTIRLFRFCTITEQIAMKFITEENKRQSDTWDKSPLAFVNFDKFDELSF